MHHGPELSVVVITAIALIAGAATRVISRRTRFPYTIAMLVVGFAVGFGLRFVAADDPLALLAMLQRGASLSPHLIIFVFLPALRHPPRSRL